MEHIGKYQIVRVLGEGGMGCVYEAVDPVIGRRVAIKTISLAILTDAEVRARFLREAQAAGQLSHPNLITIHDIGEEDNRPFIVMEYLEGEDLSRKLKGPRMPIDLRVQAMVDVCKGLGYAHGRGVVHRDIKPANLFMTQSGSVKILDFGLARGAFPGFTQTGRVVGTPNYMAPEQVRGDDIDHRVDVFSAGVVFYELLTGRKAFDGDSVAATLYKILEWRPLPLHQVDSTLPVGLSAIIERALAKDRTERYQTVDEMLDAIEVVRGTRPPSDHRSLMATTVVTPPVIVQPPPTQTTPSNQRALTLAGLAAALVLGALLGFKYLRAPAPVSVAQPPTVENPAVPRASSPSSPSSSSSATPVTPPVAEPAPTPVEPTPTAGDEQARVREPAKSSPAASRREQKPDARSVLPGRPRSETPPPQPLPKAAPTVPAPSPAAPPPSVEPDRPKPVEPAPAVVPSAPLPNPTPPPSAAPSPSVPAPVPPPPNPPPVDTSAPSPAPSAAPAPVRPNPATAVQMTLGRYKAALENRDVSALKQIWPALSGRQEDAFRTEFANARAIGVDLEDVNVHLGDSSATVTCRRNYTVTTTDGQLLKSATKMIMTLSRRDGAWAIESVRHEVAR